MDIVSIIIPTYKRSIFLKRAIDSVLKQSYKNIEIIVVDDNFCNSIERKKTEEIMLNYAKEKKIKYLKNKNNLGGALSRNEGIKIATGKYISFLDDDDEYLSSKIEKQLEFYKEKFKDKRNGFIFCQSKVFDENNKEIKKNRIMINGNEEGMFEILKTGFTSTGTLFIPKEILIKVNGFEKLICGQEWYLMLKILFEGYECYSMADELLIYYEHKNERISTNLKKIEGEKNIYEIKKKYINNLNLEKQNELHYFNNIELARQHFQFKKIEGISYLKTALKYKKIKVKDLIKLMVNYFCSNAFKLKLIEITYAIENKKKLKIKKIKE